MKKAWLAVIGLVLLMGVPVLGQDIGSGGIGGRPAFPREDNPRSQSIFVHTLDEGESVDDGINVINNSGETKTVQVYATDAVISSGGAFACAQEVEEAQDVATWIQLSKNEVTLASTESEIVPFTISVPAGTSVGEHDGCIVVAEVKPETEAEQGIGLSFRTAIRVAILVPGDITKELQINDFSVEVKPDAVIMTPVLENLGNVSVDADIQTYIKTLWSSSVSQVGGEFPVLRGQSGEWNLEHERPFWGGWYKTKLAVNYDNNPANFLGDSEEKPLSLSQSGPLIFVMPAPAALAIELGAVLLISYGIWRLVAAINQRREINKTWKTYTLKQGANLKQLAKISGVSWRTIARVNKLKPPYSLEAGQKLKLPPKKNETKSK